MSVHIASIWELGWNTPLKEAELWQFPLQDFGVDTFYMSPVSGIFSTATTQIIERPDIEEIIITHRLAGNTIVFVDEGGDTELSDFQHPTNVLYVFGKTSLSPMIAYKQPGDMSLFIKTKQDLGLLWSHQAATLVLYDRMKKGT